MLHCIVLIIACIHVRKLKKVGVSRAFILANWLIFSILVPYLNPKISSFASINFRAIST